MALILCPECGNQFSEKATHCPKCGAPTPPPIDRSKCGTLAINWDGTWALIDSTVEVAVNGNKLGKFSFKEGFSIETPIISSNVSLSIKCGLTTVNVELDLNQGEDYTVELLYSRCCANLGVALYDNNWNEIFVDNCTWWKALIAFFIPLIGVVWALCLKSTKPCTYKSMLVSAINGFLLNFFLFLIQ